MPIAANVIAAPVASGDTVRTTLGSITLPANAKRIVGVWAYGCAGAAITTAEAVSGIVEFEFSGLPNAPPNLDLPLDIIQVLTSGAVAFSPRVWEVDYSPAANVVITCFVTMDMAQTGALTCRYGIIYEY
jgi:hypothetical protein